MPLLLLASIVWGFSFGLIGNRLVGIPPAITTSIRLLLSFLFFLPFTRRVSFQIVWKLLLIGAVQFGIMYLTYIASFKYLKSHEVALFTVFTPIYIALTREHKDYSNLKLNFIAAVLAVFGATIIIFKNINIAVPVVGFFLVQISNAAFAYGQVAYRKTMSNADKYTDAGVFSWLYLGATIITIPFGLFALRSFDVTSINHVQWGVLIYLGIVASGVCFFLWNFGARKVTIGTLAVANNLKIPLAVIISLLVFGEKTSYLRLALGSITIFFAMHLSIISKTEKADSFAYKLLDDFFSRLNNIRQQAASTLLAKQISFSCFLPALLIVFILAIPICISAWSSVNNNEQPIAVNPFDMVFQPILINILMIAFAIVCALRNSGIRVSFGLTDRFPYWVQIRHGISSGLLLILIVFVFSILNDILMNQMGIEHSLQHTFQWLSEAENPVWAKIGVVSAAIIVAPIAEELLFRGILFTSMVSRINFFTALIMQGILFGAIHGHVVSFIPLTVAGIGFAIGYARTGSILTPIFMHATFNAAGFLMFYFINAT